MIYITGDIHRWRDISKLNNKNFKEQHTLTKSDYLIICGDTGLTWDTSDTTTSLVTWLEAKPFTTLWVDGNHENFDLLNTYPTTYWNGGKVHYISDSIIHLCRGEIYTIEGSKFFTMGGGTSIDKFKRVEFLDWWSQEIPNNEEFENALTNLDNHNWEVDYILTHTCSKQIMYDWLCYPKEHTILTDFLSILQEHCTYKWWFFGHFHTDQVIEYVKAVPVFNRVLNLEQFK